MDDNARILLVDDDEDIRHVLRLLFEHEGFEVVGEAADGLEAISHARSLKPDIVVIDQMMPNMTGEKAAPVLRVICPEVRIVAFSAHLSEAPEWADAYLTKQRINDIVPLLGEMVIHAL